MRKNEKKLSPIFIVIVLSVVLSFVGAVLEDYYSPENKLNRELNRFHNGGKSSEVQKIVEERNSKIEESNNRLNKVIEEYSTIFVYTNDTAIHEEARMQINAGYLPGGNYWGLSVKQQSMDIIHQLNNFFEQEDSLGYNVFVGNSSKKVLMMNLDKLDSENEYKVVYYYYYTNEEIEFLTNNLNKLPHHHFSFIQESKEEKLKQLNELQQSFSKMTEEELQNQELENSVKKVLAPTIKAGNGRFYFSSFNKDLGLIEFEKKVELFKSMFLKDQETKNNSIKELNLIASPRFESN